MNEINHNLISESENPIPCDPKDQPVPQSEAGLVARLKPYVAIARPDHWFKNVFMLAGVVLACFYTTQLPTFEHLWLLPLAFAATCLIASSNYVINEILDAPSDRKHPVKCNRPVASGECKLAFAYAEWIGLGIVGLMLAACVNFPFFLSGLSLLLMGLVYNIPPIRTKEVPYLDVISESINNPIRLLMGWFVICLVEIPPMSLLLSYWLIGAFFMASKRFAEYRAIGNKQQAAAYRKSFAYYDDNRLLVSMFFYASGAALLLGVFIIRFHLELILSVPLIAGFFSAYMHVTLKTNSAVQNPERLYKENGLLIYLMISIAVFTGLMFVDIPFLYELFNVTPSDFPALWSW